MIQNGNPGGMPPFAAVLSSEEIRAMVIYIREQGARAAREKTTFNKPAANVVVTSEKATFRLETVAEGVTAPWGIDFLPDGRILVTEKAGTLRIVEKGKLLPEPVSGVPKVLDKGQGGLLDVAVHPDYAKNGWIYLSFSDPGPEGSAMTKIVRGKLKGNAFVDVQDIFKAPTELYLEGPTTSAIASCSIARATSTSASATGSGTSTRRTRPSRTARSTASTRMAASRRTTRSSASRRRCRPSTASATATRRGSPSTPPPAWSGRSSTAPAAATS
jgi:hypothetical protein